MEATVEVLTAEVRTLMVGSRQVTLSVYKQLDTVFADEITAFGRVRSGKGDPRDIELVGVHRKTGALVRSKVEKPGTFDEHFCWDHDEPFGETHSQSIFEDHTIRLDGTWTGIVPDPPPLFVRPTRRMIRALWSGERFDGWRQRPEMTDALRAAVVEAYVDWNADKNAHHEASELPLIVLAGLR